jgi:hypothetical protein
LVVAFCIIESQPCTDTSDYNLHHEITIHFNMVEMMPEMETALRFIPHIMLNHAATRTGNRYPPSVMLTAQARNIHVLVSSGGLRRCAAAVSCCGQAFRGDGGWWGYTGSQAAEQLPPPNHR